MVDTTTMNALAWVRKQVEEADTDLLREILKLFCERVMSEEVDQICGAPYGERSDERTNRRGYRNRAWDTRTGTIELAVRKLREGSYFPDWLLEPRRRAERAFVHPRRAGEPSPGSRCTTTWSAHDDLVRARRPGPRTTTWSAARLVRRPNELWFTDITEHRTDEGNLYICADDEAAERSYAWRS